MKSIGSTTGLKHIGAGWWIGVVFIALMVAAPGVVAGEEGERAEHDLPEGGDLVDEDDRPEFDDAEEDGPPADLRADEFRDRRELEGQQRQDEAIVQLQELIDNTPEDNPDRAEYLYNLAELYWERSRYYEHSAIEQGDECFELEQQGEEQEARRCEFRQEDMFNESERLRDESIELSIEIIQNYPNFEMLDEVYFELGSNLMDNQEEQDAVEIFRRLLREFPETDYTPQALVYIGDYHFDEGEMDDALQAYEQVVQYRDAPVYQYARYKKGWAHFNQGTYQQSLDEFLVVVDLARAAEEGTADRAMLGQVRNDIVRAYARIGSPQEAISFFQREVAAEREDWLPLAETLAVYYGNEAQYGDANYMYRELIEVNSTSHRVVDYQYEIVRNAATMDSYSEEALEEMIDLLRLVQAADDGQFEEDREEYEEDIRPTVEETSHRWASTYHREARRTQNVQIYEFAHYLYQGFRQTFPESEKLYEATFFHAELLYELEQWDLASEAYESVVEIDPEGEYTEDAVHAIILALFEEVDTSEERADIEADFDDEDDAGLPEPQEMPELQQRLMEATELYIDLAPEGEDIVDVKYTRARTAYDYHHLEEAVDLFEDIAFNHSDHDLADVSANLHLDTLNRLEEFEQLADAVERYLEERPIEDREFNEDLRTLNKAIRYNICVVHDEEEEWEEAAYCYVDYVQEFPNADQADMALYNAALDFERINEIGMAIQLRRQFLERYPDSEYAAETLYNLGGNYHAWAIYGDAADYYEMFVEHFPNEEEAESALANAATFRHGLQEYEQAIENYETYLELFGDDNPGQAAEVFFEIAQIYEEQGRDDDAFDHYHDYLNHYAGQGPNDQMIRAHVNIGLHYWDSPGPNARDLALAKFDDALEAYERLSEEEQQQMIDGRDAAAEAQFMIAEDLYEDAQQISLSASDSDELEEATEEKLEAAEEAREVFQKVIEIGRPDWSIAALFRIGNGFHDFAEELRDSPVPDGLTPGQEEQYRILLEEQAMEFEDVAVQLYERSMAISRDNNWFNEYSDRAEAKLADLRPEDYREPSELRVQPVYQHDGITSAGFIDEIQEEDMLEELTDDEELAGDEEVGPGELEEGADASEPADSQSENDEQQGS